MCKFWLYMSGCVHFFSRIMAYVGPGRVGVVFRLCHGCCRVVACLLQIDYVSNAFLLRRTVARNVLVLLQLRYCVTFVFG